MSLSGEFMSYHLLLTKRSYVAPTQESASNFLTYVEDLITGYDIAKTKNVSLSLRGDFSINLKNFQKLGIEKNILSGIMLLETHDIPYSNDSSRNARDKFQSALFERSYVGRTQIPITSICCLDQYPIGSVESVLAIDEMAQKIAKDGTLYANGTRNVPVVLGQTSHANDFRIIHELYNSIAMGGSERLALDEISKQTVSLHPAYAHYGESTSGFYFLNASHLNFNKLQNETLSLGTSKIPWFEAEYFTALRASMLGDISTGVVFANENGFDISPPKHHDTSFWENEELIKFSQRVGATCEFLGSTPVKIMLQRALENQDNANGLTEYFPSELVENVKHVMLSNLKK